MSEPIQSGDKCVVISGAFGAQSPNAGQVVTVLHARGEHSQHGIIWRCAGEGLVTEYGAMGTQADFAARWLRKLPTVGPAAKTKEVAT